MPRINLIGDIHANFNVYLDIIEATPDIPSLQIGDFGLGMPANHFKYTHGINRVSEEMLEEFWVKNPMHKVIRGNHDHPLSYRGCSGYLGDYGFDESKNMFWISGAYSIDERERTAGLNWWPDEELPIPTLNDAFELFCKVRPKYVVSHECPAPVVVQMLAECKRINPEKVRVCNSRTCQALSAMLYKYPPMEWYFGHYHVDWSGEVDGTRFTCIKTFNNRIVNMDPAR